MKNLKIVLAATICFSALHVNAQTIIENIVNEKQKTLSFANVMLLKADSITLTGTVSDENGAFHLFRHYDAKYLNVSYIGYDSQYVELMSDSIVTIQLHPVASVL